MLDEDDLPTRTPMLPPMKLDDDVKEIAKKMTWRYTKRRRTTTKR